MSTLQAILPYLNQDQLGQYAGQILAQYQPQLDASYTAYCQYLQRTGQLQNNQVPNQKVAEFAELMKANTLVMYAANGLQQQPLNVQQTMQNNANAWQQIKQQTQQQPQRLQPQAAPYGQQFPTTQMPQSTMSFASQGAGSLLSAGMPEASLLTTIGAPAPQYTPPPVPQPQYTPPVQTATPAPPVVTDEKPKGQWVKNRPWEEIKPVLLQKKFLVIGPDGGAVMTSAATDLFARLSGASTIAPVPSQKPETPSGSVKVEYKKPEAATAARTLSELVGEVLLAVYEEQTSGYASRFMSRCIFAFSKTPEKATKQKNFFKTMRSKHNRNDIVGYINSVINSEDNIPEEKVMAIILATTYAKRLSYLYGAVLNIRDDSGSSLILKNLASANMIAELVTTWNPNVAAADQLNKQTINMFKEWLTVEEDGIYESVGVTGWPINYNVLNLDLTGTQSYMLNANTASYGFIHKQQTRLIKTAFEQDFKPKTFYHVTIDGTILEIIPSGFDDDEYIVTLAQG